MKDIRFRKGFVLGIIILLFFSISIQPGIIADDSIKSDNHEMVEITIQICRGDGANNHNVKLSQEKAEELENLLNITKSKLDSAKTLEETSEIFNDTVFSLYKFDMLPDDMSIEDAKLLVNGMEQNPRIIKKLERWNSKNQGKKVTMENFLCLIAGHTDETFFIGPSLIPSLLLVLIMVTPFFLLNYLFMFFDISIDLNIIPFLIQLSVIFGLFNFYTWQLNPLAVGHSIIFGYTTGGWWPHWIHAKGWIYTIGLKGIKTWNSIYGGVLGFTGIKICLSHEDGLFQTHFYMGAALMVNDQ
jgi:hypothetical protein